MAPVPRGPVVARAPGRVNLIGDHTDYCGGLAMPIAIDRWTEVTYRPDAGTQRLTLTTDVDAGPVAVDLGGGTIIGAGGEGAPGGAGAWRAGAGRAGASTPSWARLAGAVVGLAGPTAGGRAEVRSTVPLGAGPSSSAAFPVALALALGADDDPVVLARLCQRAEAAAGSDVGLLDPLAIAGARAGHAMVIDFGELGWVHVPLPEAADVVVVHSGVPRQLEGSPYRVRRAECEAAAARLAGMTPPRPAVTAEPAPLTRKEQKAAKKAKKAAKGTDVSKAAADVAAEREELLKRLEALESQPAPGITLNAAGPVAVLRGPGADQAFKAMDDRVEKARQAKESAATDLEKMRAEEELRSALQQRATAKLVAADHARKNGKLPEGRFGPNSAELFANTASIGEDTGRPGLRQYLHYRERDLRELADFLASGLIKGLKLYPGYEPFYPHDQRLRVVYELAEEFHVPVMIHSGDTYSPKGKLKYAHPLEVDEVAVGLDVPADVLPMTQLEAMRLSGGARHFERQVVRQHSGDR